MRIIERFKLKLKALHLKTKSAETEQTLYSGPFGQQQQPQQQQQTPSNNQTNQQQDISLETTPQHHECCHVLQKPDLYDAIKLAFLTENNLSFVKTSYVEGDRLDEENKLALSVLWYHSSQILNFMEQKRFKWKIGDSFSLKTSLALKETIIDTFIRLRLKEGFKCLFQCSKFCVFTIQLSMFDCGEVSSGPKTKETFTDEDKSNYRYFRKRTEAGYKNGSSQYCTLSYVVHFLKNIPLVSSEQSQTDNASVTLTAPKNPTLTRSMSSNNNGLLNHLSSTLTTQTERKLSDNLNQKIEVTDIESDKTFVDLEPSEIFFTTEMYSEVMDGVFVERRSNSSQGLSLGNKSGLRRIKERSGFATHFRNMSYKEILNLIFLTDLRCFLSIQSCNALFLAKGNGQGNLSSMIDSKEKIVDSLYLMETNSTNAALSGVCNYNSSFYESIRFLPDLNMMPRKMDSRGKNENNFQLASRFRIENPIGER